MNNNKSIRKKIAHFGAFDHDSYGDLIFPHIVEYFLPEFEFVHISPSGRDTPWGDAKRTISIDEAFKIRDWDGILVGGGDIVQITEGFIWNDSAIQSLGALCSLWSGASLLSAELDIPCAWNSPGVPHELPDAMLSMAQKAFGCVDYLTVRDEFSEKRISRHTQQPVTIVPDTALLISEMWKKPCIADDIKKPLILSLTPDDIDNRLCEIDLLIQRVSRSNKFSDDVIVLPLMRWLTSSLENKLNQLSQKYNLKIKDKNLTLQECAKEIATAGGYIGNSLHGLITAISYEIPAVLVHPFGFDGATKYAGFSNIIQSENTILAKNYIEASDLIFSHERKDISGSIQSIKEHFKKVRKTLNMCAGSKKEIWNEITNAAHSETRNLLLHGYSPYQLLHTRTNSLRNLDRQNYHLSLALEERDKKISLLSNAMNDLEAKIECLKIQQSGKLKMEYMIKNLTEKVLDQKEFLENVAHYKKQLKNCIPQEIWKLFSAVTIPYKMEESNPFSNAYKNEVLNLYEKITGIPYSPVNELTSDKQDAEKFAIGFPWSTESYHLIEQHTTKHSTFFKFLDSFDYPFQNYEVLEFGPGWGLLTIPMLKSAMNVTAVDIDNNFLNRLTKEADTIDQGGLKTINKSFIESFEEISQDFDFIVFQSCFHHEINFVELLGKCVSRMHNSSAILFLDEPILRELPFPWGLRFDGESLWAISMNNWLELGFSEDFFISLLAECGLFALIPNQQSQFTHGSYLAQKSNVEHSFSQVLLPSKCCRSFHEREFGVEGRFAKQCSILPGGTTDFTYRLSVVNYRTLDMQVKFESDLDCIDLILKPLESKIIKMRVSATGLKIISESFVPSDEVDSTDTRELGIFIHNISRIPGLSDAKL